MEEGKSQDCGDSAVESCEMASGAHCASVVMILGSGLSSRDHHSPLRQDRVQGTNWILGAARRAIAAIVSSQKEPLWTAVDGEAIGRMLKNADH